MVVAAVIADVAVEVGAAVPTPNIARVCFFSTFCFET